MSGRSDSNALSALLLLLSGSAGGAGPTALPAAKKVATVDSGSYEWHT